MKNPETKLERHVAQWLEESTEEGYSKEGIYSDLMRGGCVSGMVDHLIYTVDCVEFYGVYQQEIDAMQHSCKVIRPRRMGQYRSSCTWRLEEKPSGVVWL